MMSRNPLREVKPPWDEYGHLTELKSVSLEDTVLRWAVNDAKPTLVKDDRYGDFPPPHGQAGDMGPLAALLGTEPNYVGERLEWLWVFGPTEYQHEENQIVPNHQRGRGYIGRYRRERKAPVTLISVRSRAQTGKGCHWYWSRTHRHFPQRATVPHIIPPF